MRQLVLAIALVAVPAAVQAATLRTHTLLRGPDVLLSDLFKDAGPNAARRLGASPPAGSSIVVEAAQLGAIARQFGVDWRPASSGDRALLERPGRSLPRDTVLTAVRDALHTAGASADSDVDLPGFSSPLVPVDADPHLLVTQLDYDAESGRFTAILSLTGKAMEPINVRIAGRVDATVAVPVATARLPMGTVLSADDVQMARVRVSLLHNAVAHTLSEAVGMQLRHPTIPGQPLPRADLVRPSLVQRGALVQIALQAGGLSLTAQGVAMQSGAAGERIRIMNTASRAVLEAVISGPQEVRVLPGSAPLPRMSAGYQVVVR